MRVQIDRFEDNGWAVLLPYPEGRTSFDVPRELLPEEVSAGDIFEVRFEYDRDETLRIGPLKIFSDGSMLGRTAAMKAPFADGPGSGSLQRDPDELREGLTRLGAAVERYAATPA